MERWSGKVAVVTGASYGIGEAIVIALAKHGLIVVGLARSEEKLNAIVRNNRGNIHAMKCDMRDESNILSVFRKIEEKFGGVDILVNNAGYLDFSSLIDGSTEVWKNILETNVLGLSICTREALKSMKVKNDYGHIIHLNSILGHSVSPVIAGTIGMYPASKFAITALTESHRNELRRIGKRIKVTSISPGLVYTNMGVDAGVHVLNLENNPNKEQAPDGYLSTKDIADAVIGVLSLEPHVEIQELSLQSNAPYPAK